MIEINNKHGQVIYTYDGNDLRNADLLGADLSGAYLSGANLRGVKLRSGQREDLISALGCVVTE